MSVRIVQTDGDRFLVEDTETGERDEFERNKVELRIREGLLVLIGDVLYFTAAGMRSQGASEDEVREAEALIHQAKLEMN